jgi:hypothetical protein
MLTQSSSQGINYYRTFVDGSRHKIHLRIIISHATPITRERPPGFSKEGRITNGSQQDPSPYSGSMENVCPCSTGIMPPDPLITSIICSRLRQEHTLVRGTFTLLSTIIKSLDFLQFCNHQRCEGHVRCRSSLDGVLLFRFPRRWQTTLA